MEILIILISVIENSIVSENLFGDDNNKNSVYKYIVQVNSIAFTHINKLQIEAFALSLFNKIYNLNEFRGVVRDFLTNLKSFSGNNDELFQAEKQQQLEEAKKFEEMKRQIVPGLMPTYNQQEINRINANLQFYEEDK